MSLAGFYHDPKHGGCLRRITRYGGAYRIHGVYGDDEPRTHGYWHASLAVASRTRDAWDLRVDFSVGKPIKADDPLLRGTFEPAHRRIRWEDGNAWHQLFAHARQLRP